MNITELELPGVFLIEPRIFPDDRGIFFESFKQSAYQEAGIRETFVQDNCSVSHTGVLRGLHFQRPPHAQAKLVSVSRGSVIDVIVDLRAGSPTFGKHLVVPLSAENHHQLFIPRGFAHGFVALEEGTEFSYKVSDEWHPECESGLRWDDPALAIDWKAITGLDSSAFIIGAKDLDLPLLEDVSNIFAYEA
jgi:dTDP-4-dehydrorhamnose 3,5-epimerase